MSTAAKIAARFAREVPFSPKIKMVPLDTLSLAIEAPKGHTLTVRDSGRGSPLSDAELRASIYARGVIQPLIWKQVEGRHFVIAGNRRLRALREIFIDAPATLVPTHDVDDFGGDWREVAIDTNLTLPPHLVERYELIVALAKDMKLQPADVQARFGMSPRQFNQVMALGRMSETVRNAWKNAEIDAKTAQIFTLEPDPKEQDRIFAAVKKNGYQGRIDAHAVRSKIVPQNQREMGQLVAFVGVDSARKAGLIKREDLFSNDHIVTDAKALNKLVGDKVAGVCAALLKDGWGWAVPENRIEGNSWAYGSIEPSAKDAKATPEEKARLEEIEKLIHGPEVEDDDALIDERERIQETIKSRGFTPAQRAKGGCFVKIGHDGSLVIEYGKIKPSERKSVEATERVAKKAAKKKPGTVTLTNALAERLSEQLEKALAASLHATPHVAVAALIAAFASNGHVLDVNVGGLSKSRYGSSGSADEKNFTQVFEGAMKSTAEARVVMLTKIAAEALSIQVHNAEAKPPLAGLGLQIMVEEMDGKFLNNAIAESFDAKDYFAGVNMQACIDAVHCAMGEEHAAKVSKMKKGDAAKFAAANVPAKGWLPKELRTVHYKGPVESVTEKELKKLAADGAKKKAAKAAPTKKVAKKRAAKK
jgi:ParB family chromosome partitioning protein